MMNSYPPDKSSRLSLPNAGDHTVLAPVRSNPGASSTRTSLTGSGEATNYDLLNDRMVYTASVQAAKGFHIGVNPLLEGAASVLSTWKSLSGMTMENHSGLDELNHDIQEGIRNYEYHALSAGVQRDEVMVGRYILCTAMDEAVTSKPWGEHGNWARNSLLSHFHNETYGGEKVFSLIEELVKNPARYLNLIELAYICLSLGFEGKYRTLNRGNMHVEALRDSLYRQIRILRGDIVQEFSPNWKNQSKHRNKMVRSAPVRTIAVLTAVSLAVLFGGFTYVLRQESQDVSSLYQTTAIEGKQLRNDRSASLQNGYQERKVQ